MHLCRHCRLVSAGPPNPANITWILVGAMSSVAGVYCGPRDQRWPDDPPSIEHRDRRSASTWPDRMDYVFADLTPTLACWRCETPLWYWISARRTPVQLLQREAGHPIAISAHLAEDLVRKQFRELASPDGARCLTSCNG